MPRPFPRHRLVALLLALSTGTCVSAAPSLIAPELSSGSAAAYNDLAVRFGTDADLRSADGFMRIANAWRRTPDIDARIVGLASLQRALAPLGAQQANERLAFSVLDLAGHAALGKAGHRMHAELAQQLAARIRATGDGSSTAPMRVTSAADAVAKLHLAGERTLGGYYGTPSADRLTLVLFSTEADSPLVTRRHFDLSTTLSAWRRGTAWSGDASAPRRARDLVDLYSRAGDHFALTSTGLRTVNERGDRGHYAAARALADAAEAGNGVARYALGDLYLMLAEERPSVADAARAGALEHFTVAAEAGFGYAHLRLAGIARQAGDRARAIRHFEQAHLRGEQDALMALASLLDETNPGAADALLAEAAAQGKHAAAYHYAVRRLERDDTPDPTALAGLRRAADAGHTEARLYLGDLAATGRHIERDHDLARSLWIDVLRTATDTRSVLSAARALTLNTTPALHDPAAAIAGLERLLADSKVARECAECWLALAEAKAGRGEGRAADAVLASGRRAPADASALPARAPAAGDRRLRQPRRPSAADS
ncbi:MAG: hypothetical protein VX766_18240 [Pseudomonadota bacterium]|nr:hypothetical protein [Pseudomonadota bacterium]